MSVGRYNKKLLGNITAKRIAAIERKNLKIRKYLMKLLIQYIREEGFSQFEAAKLLGVAQPRISNLMNEKIDLFSVDILLNMMEGFGFSVYKDIASNIYKFFRPQNKRYAKPPLSLS
jgi:predicted XRE-type DNA-binding protein